jgi:hypothetical protein
MNKLFTIKTFSADPVSSEMIESFEDPGNAADIFEFWANKAAQLTREEAEEDSILSLTMVLFDDSGHILKNYHRLF